MQTLGGKKRVFLALVAGLSLAAAVGPAMAACYEDEIGCTDDHRISTDALRNLNCDDLWTIRNAIYNDHGYCFKTKAAQNVFDNSDCTTNSTSQLGLNRYEQANIDRIVSVEKEFACY